MNGFDEDAFRLESLRVGEIDLAALSRAHRLMMRYFERPCSDIGITDNNDEDPALSIRGVFIRYATCEGPHKNERELAFRMIFEEMLAVPDLLKEIDKRLELKSCLKEDE